MSGPAEKRRPRGYAGKNHMTRGGDIVAILEIVLLPELSLGREVAERLRAVNRDDWYPIEDLLTLYEHLDKKLGASHLKQVGWKIFKRYHAEDTRKRFSNAKALFEALDRMYRDGNKGDQIGGWKLTRFDDHMAELEKTTPHHCAMEEGLLEEALRTLGVIATVKQVECFRKGSDLCRYVIRPSLADARWLG